ncbi:MAG: HAMP domain-containing protein [Chloroflexi bacterium]|nr:HAMP domain-containing protein [Chloroflexota bacterium]
MHKPKLPRRLGAVWHSRIPIRVRLTLWYVLAMAFLLFSFAIFLHARVEPRLEEQTDMTMDVVAELTQHHIIESDGDLAFRNRDSLEDDYSSNLALYLLSDDGTVWDSVGADEDIPVFFPPQAGFTTEDDQKRGPREWEWRVYSLPVPEDDPVGWLQITQKRDVMGTLRGHICLGLPVGMLFAGLGGIFLATRVLRPIKNMTTTTRQITANDLHQRIDYTGPQDEIGRLAATLDGMLDRLEAGFERERRFTSDAAHELRTPLTALKGQIGVALSQPRQPRDYECTLRDLEGQVDRLIRLSSDLLLLARLEHRRMAEQHEQIMLADLLLALVDQVMMLAEEKHITLTGDVQPELTFTGNMNLLIRLFLNLLDNAIKYTPEGGTVTLRACQEADRIRVSVSDTGPGIPADQLPHLFEPFFRVESDRGRGPTQAGGAGLGLAIAHEIARAHDGSIAIKSTPGHGSTFTVYLPLAPTPPAPRKP